jgi:hypothetical protein
VGLDPDAGHIVGKYVLVRLKQLPTFLNLLARAYYLPDTGTRWRSYILHIIEWEAGGRRFGNQSVY